MAALSLDARRVSQGRLDLAPWLKKREAKDRCDDRAHHFSSFPVAYVALLELR